MRLIDLAVVVIVALLGMVCLAIPVALYAFIVYEVAG